MPGVPSNCTSVAADFTPQPLVAGPHLLETWLAAARGSTAQRQSAARAEALAQIGWRHSRLRVGQARTATGPAAAWLGAARWWLDRNAVGQQMAELHPDIIETADPFALGGAVLDTADRLGVPAVAHCSGTALLGLRTPASLAEEGRSCAWAERRALGLLRRVYDGYDLVLASSRAQVAQLQSVGVAHAAYQPIGVDCAVFNPNACDHAWRHELEARLHLVPGTRLLVYVGRFSAAMRLDLLVGAVQALGPGHALLAVGEGPQPPQGAQVHCLAPPTDDAALARLLASCDAFVHAGGAAETCGAATLEAMACGLPVVVSREGAPGEIAAAAGTLVERSSAVELAEALHAAVRATSWPHFWAALERARMHDWGVVVQEQALRYRQALGSARSSSEAKALDQLDEAQPALTP